MEARSVETWKKEGRCFFHPVDAREVVNQLGVKHLCPWVKFISKELMPESLHYSKVEMGT